MTVTGLELGRECKTCGPSEQGTPARLGLGLGLELGIGFGFGFGLGFAGHACEQG